MMFRSVKVCLFRNKACRSNLIELAVNLIQHLPVVRLTGKGELHNHSVNAT